MGDELFQPNAKRKINICEKNEKIGESGENFSDLKIKLTCM